MRSRRGGEVRTSLIGIERFVNVVFRRGGVTDGELKLTDGWRALD